MLDIDTIMGNVFGKAAALDFGIQWGCWAVAALLKTEKFYDLAGKFYNNPFLCSFARDFVCTRIVRIISLDACTRPSSPVRQDGERRTTFLNEYALRLVPFSRFGSFFVVLTSDFQFIDAIINNARCACHP